MQNLSIKSCNTSWSTMYNTLQKNSCNTFWRLVNNIQKPPGPLLRATPVYHRCTTPRKSQTQATVVASFLGTQFSATYDRTRGWLPTCWSISRYSPPSNCAIGSTNKICFLSLLQRGTEPRVRVAQHRNRNAATSTYRKPRSAMGQGKRRGTL